MAYDKNGDLIIADVTGGALLRVSMANGLVSSITRQSTDRKASGDGGPATLATAAYPYDAMFNAAGNLYFSDQGAGTVRQISASTGIVRAVAGYANIQRSSCDGGRALDATFYGARWMAMDSTGTIYVTDYTRIRRLTCVPTFPGGPQSPSPSPSPRLLSPSPSPLPPPSPTPIPWVRPAGPAAPGSACSTDYLVDAFAGTDSSSGPANRTIAGATLGGVVVDKAGNVYVADVRKHRVVKLDVSTGALIHIAGTSPGQPLGDGGPASSASLKSPSGLAIRPTGDLYIADTYNRRIRKINASTGVISTVAGNGTAGSSGDGGPATAATFVTPKKVRLDSKGNLLIVDILGYRIRRVDARSGIISTVAGRCSDGCSGGSCSSIHTYSCIL